MQLRKILENLREGPNKYVDECVREAQSLYKKIGTAAVAFASDGTV